MRYCRWIPTSEMAVPMRRLSFTWSLYGNRTASLPAVWLRWRRWRAFRPMTPTREAEAADALDHVKGWLETLDASLAHARNDIATALVWIGNYMDQIKPKKKRRKRK